jgi:hypothetical protein
MVPGDISLSLSTLARVSWLPRKEKKRGLSLKQLQRHGSRTEESLIKTRNSQRSRRQIKEVSPIDQVYAGSKPNGRLKNVEQQP